ncbi:hypothetical protein BG000_007533 [Podila horticola]|nr:hypothetical protein BG000_007533 [Podila horticola]
MTDRGRGPVGRPASGQAPPQPQPASGYRIPPQSYEYDHDREPLERRHDFDQDRAPLHQHLSHARYDSYDDDRHHLAHTQHPPYRRGYEDYPAYTPDHTPAPTALLLITLCQHQGRVLQLDIRVTLTITLTLLGKLPTLATQRILDHARCPPQ